MPLTERQEKAAALAVELGKLGAHVLSILPLDEGAKGLRVQILESDRKRIEAILKEWGWDLIYVNYAPRITYAGMTPAGLFEIDIPRPRMSLPDPDNRIPGQIITERKATSAEVEAVKKYLGLK